MIVLSDLSVIADGEAVKSKDPVAPATVRVEDLQATVKALVKKAVESAGPRHPIPTAGDGGKQHASLNNLSGDLSPEMIRATLVGWPTKSCVRAHWGGQHNVIVCPWSK